MEKTNGKIVATCISPVRGMKKRPTLFCRLIKNYGIEGDAHAGSHKRQISLLSLEAIKKMQKAGINAEPGIFAENLTTNGIDLASLKIGDRLCLGMEAVIEITQIGKECTTPCAIYRQAGDCIMPREGVFAVVVKGGDVSVGNRIIKI